MQKGSLRLGGCETRGLCVFSMESGMTLSTFTFAESGEKENRIFYHESDISPPEKVRGHGLRRKDAPLNECSSFH